MSNALSPSISASGKKIFWLPKDEHKVNTLKRAARNGNYYAALAMKQLRQLSTGAVHNSNVFIPNINNSRASTFQMFSVYLPGIRADLERRSDDTYKIIHLELDASFDSSKTEVKPGFYECERDGRVIKTTYRTNKLVKADDGRVVVICGSEFEDPELAAQTVANQLEDIAGRSASLLGKFDIYFAPKGNAPEGMRHFKAEKNTQATMHSSMLANAMDVARKKRAVFWASLDSGSAILTQSVNTLHRRQISFANANHEVTFVNPETDPRAAINHAKQIGLKVHATKSIQGGTLRVRMACAMSLRRRAMDKDDPYTLKHLGLDTAQGALTCVGAAGVGLFAATTFATAAPAVTAAATLVSGVGALQTLHSLIKKARGK